MERMNDFFAARVGDYDRHMLQNVEGCREGYVRLAELLPASAQTLLDLGCGTGLELDEIFRRLPGLQVTGVDMTQEMLDALRRKHPDRKLTLLCQSYFDLDFGKASFDAAVSVQSLHHFSHDKKRGLYSRIRQSLKPGGVYIECDYMVETQREEDAAFEENRRLRRSLGIREDEFYHFDTPCTVENQVRLLREAGFPEARALWRQGNTTLILAKT